MAEMSCNLRRASLNSGNSSNHIWLQDGSLSPFNENLEQHSCLVDIVLARMFFIFYMYINDIFLWLGESRGSANMKWENFALIVVKCHINVHELCVSESY